MNWVGVLDGRMEGWDNGQMDQRMDRLTDQHSGV